MFFGVSKGACDISTGYIISFFAGKSKPGADSSAIMAKSKPGTPMYSVVVYRVLCKIL